MTINPLNRRQLLKRSSQFLAGATLAQLLAEEQQTAVNYRIPAKAKRLIYIFNSGGPSQVDLYDYKPIMQKWHGKELPASIRKNQRLTTMTSSQGHLKIAASAYKFFQDKETGIYLSELLPNLLKATKEISFIKSMHTDEINHDPGMCYLNTGSAIPGKASIGSWLSYGLGTMNKNLPAYITLLSRYISNQSLNARLWNSGFLPAKHQGTRFFGNKNAVLYLQSPDNISKKERLQQLELIKELNKDKFAQVHDPEIEARTAQYELACRMQTSVPEVTDLSKESPKTLEMYGEDVNRPGSYAHNCILARKLVESGVRVVQMFHRGWDHHELLPRSLPNICKITDRPTYALIQDLKQRGLLEDTLVVSASEFGRTIYCQGNISTSNYGRDHHGRCFTAWMAGAGVKKGFSLGSTDDFSYNITEDPVSVEQFNATILKLMGIDHEKLSYFHNGLDQRLTGVEPTDYIRKILL